MKAKEQATRRLWKTPRNLLTLQDCCGIQLVFPELEGMEDPQVGDKATVDGMDVEGEHLMPDGTLLVFVDGEIVKVVEPSAESLATARKMINNSKSKTRKLWKQQRN